jgi:multiple sugar transport system permease protein
MKRRHNINKLLLFALTIPVFIFIYLPLVWLVISSISTRAELLSIPLHWIPQNPTLQNYIDILTPGATTSEVASTFKITMRNSLFVASMVTLISLLVGSLAAYALVRIEFRARGALLIGVLGTRMIPEISLVIPLLCSHPRSLLNSPTSDRYIFICIAICDLVMAAFFETVLRGGGCLRTWLFAPGTRSDRDPISAPGLVSTALFVFLLALNFLRPDFTSTVSAKTVPVAIAEFTGRYAVDITAMMTGGVLAALPPVILALIFQRYIVSGLTAGAIKG